MQLARLVEVSSTVRETRSRNAKIDALAALLIDAGHEEAPLAVAWLAGVLPQGRIGVGWAALQEVQGTPPAAAPSLTLRDVDQAFTALAAIRGKGSTARRREALTDLLGRATPEEQVFLMRLLLGELRQGAQEGVMLDGVARAAGIPSEILRRAWMLSGDLVTAATTALREGAPGLDRFRLTVFQPVQPMLAQTAEDPAEALSLLGEAIFDVKLDGARVQVHRQGSVVRVYSRQLRDVTAAVPEVVEAALALPADRLILDGEALALRADGRPQPFQVTMQRFGSRIDVPKLRRELPLQVFFFDVLAIDENDLLDRPLGERLAALDRLVPEHQRVTRLRTADVTAANAFLADTLSTGHEGAMAKDPACPYAAGSRGRAWLKVKQAHTLDLVVIAAEWGSGRRRGWLSNLHLAARDPETGGFVMLGKTFKGLTDALLAWQTEELLARETRREGHVVHVRPELVVEIAFNDVQDSPRYPAGLALRFARVKAYRPDKPPEEADTIETVRAIHQAAREPG